MTTFILVLIVVTALFAVPVWGGYKRYVDSHHLDLMAGDEGDD